MLTSNNRKKALSGWLKENYTAGFYSPLKLQKFLFFYESLCKVDGIESDFSYLKGYENGPVFSDVYGDYYYRKDNFLIEVQQSYDNNRELINDENAIFSRFLVNIMTEEELSDLTHEFNIWKSKEQQIRSGQRHVSLDEQDLNRQDSELLKTLRDMYSPEYIESVYVLEFFGKSFIINKSDLPNLTEDQKDALIKLSTNESLDNPVYVTLSEDGVVIVD